MSSEDRQASPRALPWRERTGRPGAARRRRVGHPERRGCGSTCTSTRSPRTASPTWRPSSRPPSPGGLDAIAITDHERIDAALAARDIAAGRGLPIEVIVGEEISTRGGHLVGLWMTRARAALALAAALHRHGPRAGRAGHRRPSAAALPDVRQRADHPPAHGRARPHLPPRRPRGLQPDDGPHALEPQGGGAGGGARHRRRGRLGRPSRRQGRQRRDHRPWRGRPGTCEPPSRRGTRPGTAGPTRWPEQLRMFGHQQRKNAAAVRDELRGLVRRDGSGRDLGYPGGRRRPRPLRPRRGRPARPGRRLVRCGPGGRSRPEGRA